MTSPTPVRRISIGTPQGLFRRDREAVGDRRCQATSTGAGVFAAAQGKVRQYVIEQDPPMEPFSFAAKSFEYVDCLVF